MVKHNKKKHENQTPASAKASNITLNKHALIAAILNLILVGLGYAFLKQYKRAILTLIAYILIYIVIFYISTFVPILIWLGLPVTLYFVYDAYKRGENTKEFLFKFS